MYLVAQKQYDTENNDNCTIRMSITYSCMDLYIIIFHNYVARQYRCRWRLRHLVLNASTGTGTDSAYRR